MRVSNAVAISGAPDDELNADAVISEEIARFLSGETDGAAVLEALYGAAIDEPIPARLLAALRGQ